MTILKNSLWIGFLFKFCFFFAFSIDLQLKKSLPNTNSNYYSNYPEDDDNRELELDLPQIQTEFEQDEHQLRSREACLAEYENLQREIEDIQELFFKLNGAVVEQKDDVQAVEDNVVETQEHVVEAEKQLRQALTYKKAMYPLCGAILGFCVAGPVGMVTFGLKAGSLAAVGCGILGATGGSVLKNKQEPSPSENHAETDIETTVVDWYPSKCTINWTFFRYIKMYIPDSNESLHHFCIFVSNCFIFKSQTTC